MSTRGGARPNSGRKPKDEENRIRDLMRPYSLDAIKCLANIINNEESKDSDRISASKIVIEYTYGKPKESIDLTTDGQAFSFLTPEQARQKAKDLENDY
jgi:hypothetical protein